MLIRFHDTNDYVVKGSFFWNVEYVEGLRLLRGLGAYLNNLNPSTYSTT
jgi:hypothetical protein